MAASFAGPLIRNLATVGGNICDASPAADVSPPLLALGARLNLECAGGTSRALSLQEFFRGVRRTALRSGELLTSIELPRPDPRVLITVDPASEAMFGARVVNTTLRDTLAARTEVAVQNTGVFDVPKSQRSLISRVFADEDVAISTGTDAHGVTTTSVKSAEGADVLEDILLTRSIEGDDVPVVLVSEETREAVYRNRDPQVPTLAPGNYVRLINAEMLTGLLNPIFVVLLTPVVVAFFAWRIRRGKPITTARKIFYGMVIATISLLVMAIGASLGQDGAIKTSMIWLVLYYLIITFGELCLSPMGLSLVTKLSPKRLVGLMMGGWFLATSVGNKLAGFISGLEPGTTMFVVLAGAILLVAGFIFAMLPRLDAAIKKYGA